MEIKGRVFQILPERSGVNKAGNPWKALQFVLQVDDVFHKYIVFEIFGDDKIELMHVQVGEDLKVYFDIEAREYQGKWYNQVRAWRVEREAEAAPIPMPGPQPEPQPLPFADELDKLPF